MKYPESNTLVVRRTAATLKNSCFTELRWAIRRFGVEHLWRVTLNPLEMTYLPTGQKIYFRGLDDPLKVTSITVDVGVLCWMWIEEGYEIMDEEDFNTLDESIRGVAPLGLFKQITITFNPWNELHWLKRRFFDTVSPDILALTTNYMCNEWLDDRDRQLFEDMKKNRPKRYEVAGLGNWGVAKGLIFDNWKVEDLSGREAEFDRLRFGCDFGYAADPNALIKLHIDRKRKKIYILGEVYRSGMSDAELLRVAGEFAGRNYITCDSADPKTIDFLADNGVNAIPAVKGPDSVNRGIRWLLDYEIIVDSGCENFKKEISQYRWEEDKYGNTLARPVDADNHLMDALRYAVEGDMLEARIQAGKRL